MSKTSYTILAEEPFANRMTFLQIILCTLIVGGMGRSQMIFPTRLLTVWEDRVETGPLAPIRKDF
jgi:hypothetical protein